MQDFRLTIVPNNFDLIRLFAASQVAVLHVNDYLWPEANRSLFARILDLFPGVPIFFFISGFLISRSFEHSQTVWNFARNRFLRIFPALHVCVAINIALVAATGYFAAVDASALEVLILFAAKTTFLQFYNPDFMRQFGDGVLNGSLWTISVELQFYLLTPLIYLLFVGKRSPRTNTALVGVMFASLICNRGMYALQPEYGETVFWKLAHVSFVPWIYMFIWGVILQRNFRAIARFLPVNRLGVAALIYIGTALVMQRNGARLDNAISPFMFFCLTYLVTLAAYSKPSIAGRMLRGNDVSYGIYIYHMPVMNMVLHYSIVGATAALLTLVASLALAIASWILIERPALRFKRRATRGAPHPDGAATRRG